MRLVAQVRFPLVVLVGSSGSGVRCVAATRALIEGRRFAVPRCWSKRDSNPQCHEKLEHAKKDARNWRRFWRTELPSSRQRRLSPSVRSDPRSLGRPSRTECCRNAGPVRQTTDLSLAATVDAASMMTSPRELFMFVAGSRSKMRKQQVDHNREHKRYEYDDQCHAFDVRVLEDRPGCREQDHT